MLKRITIGLALAGVVLGGGGAVEVATASHASALTCVNKVTTWQAYNECAGVPARHWDAIRNSASKYGNWASAKQWSKQSSCWTNVVSFGYSLKS